MPNRIKELRNGLGLTLDEVAARAGTSLQQVQRLEKGERRLTDDWMRRLGKALGVHPSALLSDSLPNSDRVAQDAEDALVLRFWHSLDPTEKRMFAAVARDKGMEILADKPKKRPA